MTVATQTKSLSRSFVGRLAPAVSHEARQLVALGRERGWDCAVLGNAALPTEPVRLGDWLIVPAHQDSSQVPARALERVQAIYAAGIRPKGFVLVHEAPKLLPAPVDSEPSSFRLSALSERFKSGLKVASSALGALAVVAAAAGTAILAAAAMALAAALALPALLVVGAVMVDPILVAVTEDGWFIEIDRWWD